MKTKNPFEIVSSAFRHSPWIMISASVHVIAIAILAVWFIAKPAAQLANEDPIRIHSELTHEPELVPDPMPVTVRDKIPPMNQTESVLTEEIVPLDIPTTPLTEPPDPNMKIGDPLSELAGSPDSSGSIGPGKGSRRGRVHSPYGDRGIPGLGDGFGPGKNPPLTVMDKLVLDGLRWLARHQNADGSWSTLGLRDHCSADQPCADPKQAWNHNYDEGLTGMALLAYLGAGFSHESKQWLLDPITHQRWQVGEVVKKGLRWLKERQNTDGSFSRDRAFLYNEALATLALTEAYGLTQHPFWHESAQRGIEFLERAQRPNPSGQGLWGWRYASRQEIEAKYPGGSLDETGKKELFDSDLSVTGWCVMALKSAQLSKLAVEPGALEGALAFTKWVSTPEGLAGYLDAKGAGAKVSGVDDQYTYHCGSMSALAMCVRAFTAHDPADGFLEPAAKRLVSDLPKQGKDGLETDYYYWYYGSLALHQFDGPDSPRHSNRYWGPWNEAMVEVLKATQNHDPKSCHDGGWLIPDRWSHSGGPVYATAINVLTAEVYYRYANAFGGRRH
jgi:Prenyltransferase and squalene oxidase repeat